jgi:predicted DsbA family dithiol-disulfide isomerase
MQVEIWAEVTCPWCGLASHRVHRAVERFEHGDEVTVVHRSFPSGDFSEGQILSVREARMRQHGIDAAEAEASTRRIEALAESEGLSPYHVLDNQVGNTELAHEFLAHASIEGKNREAWDAIFRAYFGRAESVFALEDLLKLSDEFGLDREQTRQVLTERSYRAVVRGDARRAQRLGATGAPFIVMDGRHGVARTQKTGILLDRLRTAWSEAHPLAPVSEGDAPVSGPDGRAGQAGAVGLGWQ